MMFLTGRADPDTQGLRNVWKVGRIEVGSWKLEVERTIFSSLLECNAIRLMLSLAEVGGRGARTGGRGHPLEPKTLDFEGFFCKISNDVSFNFSECVSKLFPMWEDRGSLQHGKELT